MFRFLAGQLASAWRLLPAAPVDLDPPVPSRRLIDAPIVHDWSCLAASGRGGETWKGVSVSYEKKKTTQGPVVHVTVHVEIRIYRDFYQMLF